MVRYELDATNDQVRARFADGRCVRVTASRARRYPGLASAAPDTTDAYRVVAARLLERGVRGQIVDLGAGAAEGAALLASHGLGVRAVEKDAQAVEFARAAHADVDVVKSPIERAPLGDARAVVLVDVLGLVGDDVALVRAIARGARRDAVLLGAAARADLGHHLTAPARREFTEVALEATLLRAGYAPPTVLATTPGFVIFEATLAPTTTLADALRAADAATCHAARAQCLADLADLATTLAEPVELREVLLAIGLLQLAAGELEAAEEALLGANAADPRDPRPFVALAGAREREGSVDDALDLLDHAVTADPAHAPSWRALASLHAARGDVASAEECLAQAAALEPGDPTVARRLAHWCQLRGDTAGVVEALSRMIAYGDTNTNTRESYPGLMFVPAARPTAAIPSQE